MGMGFIDTFPFSLGNFALLEDLTDCSSDTVTYVDRRRSSTSQSKDKDKDKDRDRDKSKSKSKSRQSTTTATRAHTSTHEHVTVTTSKHGPAAGTGSGTVVKRPETARSTTVANLNVREEDVRLRVVAATNVSAKRSTANETIAKRSTVTAPAAPGREPSRRVRREKREEQREQKATPKKEEPKKEEAKQEPKKEEMNVEVITTSKETVRSVSRSREPSHAPQPSEVETRPDLSPGELRKENRALRRRMERLEKDLAAYRRHAEHYRDRRRETDRERVKAEERVRELETVVTNMRDSYELELDDLRGRITEYTAKAAAVASATQVYAEGITGQSEERAQGKPPSVKKAPSLRDLAVQTEPEPIETPPPRPSAPLPGDIPPTSEIMLREATLLAKLQQREGELIALRLFHEEVPQISLVSLTSFVKTLNTELRTLALLMIRDIRLSPPWEAAQAWALDAAEPSLARCLRLLSDVKGADFRQDITLVRLALQAWIVSCLQRVFEKFLFGLEVTEDEMLRKVFERVQARESPPVAARWRALTRRYARSLVSRSVPLSSSRGGYAAARDHTIHLLEIDILVGAEAILRFSGAELPPGILLQKLSTSLGKRISRVVKRATKLASDLAERAPVGCEVFTAHLHDGEDGESEVEHGAGMALCGCMESVDQECRQWVGQVPRTERDGRTAGTRTRAGTVRNKSKTRSHATRRTARTTRTARTARTATTRTWADTIIRQWDKDSDEDYEDSSDEEEEEEDEEEVETEEDQFVENVNVNTPARPATIPELEVEGVERGWAQPIVLCSLGFGLRRVIRQRHRRRQNHLPHPPPPPGATGESPTTPRPQHESLRNSRRLGRVPKPEVETLHGSQSDADMQTFTLTSLAPTSPLTTRQSRRRRNGAGEHGESGQGGAQRPEDEGEGGVGGEGEEDGREVEVLVKTDVLVSTTVDALRRRVGHY